MIVQFWINDKKICIEADPGESLLNTLRRLGYTSVKNGCEEGQCGACTVWIEEKPELSCKKLTVSLDEMHVTTLEGVQKEAEKFSGYLLDEGVEQCGYCSPGFIMLVLAMKKELKNPDKDSIKRYINGNLCRCSGYLGRMRAIEQYIQLAEKEVVRK